MKINPNALRSMVKARARLIGLIVVAFVIFGVPILGIVTGHSVSWVGSTSRVEHYLETISKTGLSGLLIVVTIMIIIASTGFLPASIIGIASGTIYGLFGGFLISAFATLLGAWASFVVSRSFFRESFERLFMRRGRMQTLGNEVLRHGWRFVCLLRMSPIMPFAITSYALGLSPVSGRDYTLGTIASLPALFGYVCIGWFARNSIRQRDPGVHYFQWAILAIGIAATLILTLYIKRVLSTRINKDERM